MDYLDYGFDSDEEKGSQRRRDYLNGKDICDEELAEIATDEENDDIWW